MPCRAPYKKWTWLVLTSNSHVPFSAPAVPCLAVSCRADMHMPFCAPCMLRIAASFVKARVVDGKIQTANPAA